MVRMKVKDHNKLHREAWPEIKDEIKHIEDEIIEDDIFLMKSKEEKIKEQKFRIRKILSRLSIYWSQEFIWEKIWCSQWPISSLWRMEINRATALKEYEIKLLKLEQILVESNKEHIIPEARWGRKY